MRRRRERIEDLLSRARRAEHAEQWDAAWELYRAAGDLMRGGDELIAARAKEFECAANSPRATRIVLEEVDAFASLVVPT